MTVVMVMVRAVRFWHALEDLEFQMDLPRPVLVIQLQSPGHGRQRMGERGVHGGQFLEEEHQEVRIEDAGALGEAAQTEAGQMKVLLDSPQVAGLLAAPQAGEDGREEVEQQVGDQVIVVQRAVGDVLLGAQSLEEFGDVPQVFGALDIAVGGTPRGGAAGLFSLASHCPSSGAA